jgi:CSLREA domain-containing protein
MHTTSLKLAIGFLLLLALTGCGTQLAGVERDANLLVQLSTGPVVNSLADPGDGVCDDTECTLREAIAAADPGATITFAVTGTITLEEVAELVIDKDLVIAGPGASSLSVSGGYSEGAPGRDGRVFQIKAGATVSISGLTVTGGWSWPSGGGIYNAGTLSITECLVNGNQAINGGAIYNDKGLLTLTNSTVSGNTPTGEDPSGGGIFNWAGTLMLTGSTVSGNSSDQGAGIASAKGTLVITRSTISGNSGRHGGGIHLWEATATITESTISENWAKYGGGVDNLHSALTLERSTISGNRSGRGAGVLSRTDPDDPAQHTTILNSTVSGNTSGLPDEEGDFFGGGIYNELGLTRIILSTVTGNHAGVSGGGVYMAAGTFEEGIATTEVKGSLIWGNTSVVGTPDDVAAIFSAQNEYLSLGHNLVGEAGGLAGMFDETSDQTFVGDALLGPLADNGGPTDTHALLPGSPAIDTGACADHAGGTVANDQRDVPRPQGQGCDIGAYESEVGHLVFTGFASPVNDAPTLNIARAGQTIPLKWHLADASGHPITDLESVTVTVTGLACPTGTAADAVEEYAAGTSGLQNLGDGYYQYNWATPKGYARSCKTMRLDHGDGVAHTALFQFTR